MREELARRKAAVKWKKIGDGGILLDLHSGDYYELDATALSIWKLIDGRTTARGMAERLARHYAAPPATVEKDVKRFLLELKKRGLIETARRS